MFIEKAYIGKNQLWRYILSAFIIIFATVLGTVPYRIILEYYAAKNNVGQDAITSMDFEKLGINSNAVVFLILLSFVFGFFALWMVVKYVHKRGFLSAITSRKRFNFNKFFFSAALWLVLIIIVELISYMIAPGNYTWNLDLKVFIPLIVLTLLIIPVQTSFEEVFLRGYLMQGFGLALKNRWMPLVITSVLFGLLHMTNPEVGEHGMAIMMAHYIGFGLFLGIFVLLDKGLEIPLGIHAINNIYGTLLVNTSGAALSTSSLIKCTKVDPFNSFIAWLAMALVFGFIAVKKYKITNWKSIFEKIR